MDTFRTEEKLQFHAPRKGKYATGSEDHEKDRLQGLLLITGRLLLSVIIPHKETKVHLTVSADF